MHNCDVYVCCCFFGLAVDIVVDIVVVDDDVVYDDVVVDTVDVVINVFLLDCA